VRQKTGASGSSGSAALHGAPVVLVIEDDAVVAETLALYLEQDGFAVDRAGDGVEGLRRASRGGVSLVILDLMIPALSGEEVCARLRAVSAVPILMLTARTSDADRIRGLELGADDYVGKPFSPREIVLRVRALLRRAGERPSEPAPLRVGVLEVDTWRRAVRVNARPAPLTATEFRLVEALARHPGRAFTRDELLARAFGHDSEALDRTVDVHITNIRRKFESLGAKQCILTVHGIGYRLAAPDDE
jgi:two-component system, OmpR family, response regulator AdeR